jgi:Uma2 family endonuclease
MSPPGFAHAIVSQNLSLRLMEVVNSQQLGQVIVAEAGFIVDRNPDTVMAPDGAFVRKERLESIGSPATYFPEPPSLIFEVVSPHDTVNEVTDKMRRWLEAGVELAWVVHPSSRTVTVYRSLEEISVLTDKDLLSGGSVVPGFECPVADLFQGL